MKKYCLALYFLSLWLGYTETFAQQNAKAREILDKTAATIKNSGGIRATFDGTQEGTILLENEKFYLNNGAVETWFDGKTQWSYVKANEEVNISHPTPEELQDTNPYFLVYFYKRGYDYSYGGIKKINGKSGYEILLTPQAPSNITAITLLIADDYLPFHLRIEAKNQPIQIIHIRSYRLHQNFNKDTFKCDLKKYPQAETIELR